MLGKRSRPTIERLTGALRSTGIVDSSTSPRSPLDCALDSPKGPKNYDHHCGVGLGLVVALNNNKNNNTNCNNSKNNCGGEILAKYDLRARISSRSNPIPMNNSLSIDNHIYECDMYQGFDDMLEEEFTYVTCHGPNKSVTTRVYYDGADYGRVMGRGTSPNLGVFKISSPATTLFDDNYSNRRNSNFLSSCHLCKKTLHGKDIYMYRGEKAFCSEECRQRQIGIDERKELCTSEASKSINVSCSPYSYNNRRGIIVF